VTLTPSFCALGVELAIKKQQPHQQQTLAQPPPVHISNLHPLLQTGVRMEALQAYQMHSKQRMWKTECGQGATLLVRRPPITTCRALFTHRDLLGRIT